jgi:asparagine synthase (glutamine-hydrolysing)
MCGIAGYTTLGSKAFIDPQWIEPMLDCLEHRGPDDRGHILFSQVALGNTRLSIIDIEHGHQPISNEDETIVVVFNGEIYNFSELRAELEKKGHFFKTFSDTEVIVHLYEEEGENFGRDGE